jgi:hypothetical protein
MSGDEETGFCVFSEFSDWITGLGKATRENIHFDVKTTI